MKVRELLKSEIAKLKKNGIEDAVFMARKLMTYELGVKSEYLAVCLEEEINEEVAKKCEKHIQEVIKGKPIQYITNEQEFFGLPFYVDENVLIPQPDTEILVEEVLQIAENRNCNGPILDICTGSGAIAIAIAKHRKMRMMASDISSKALEIAQKNAIANGVNITFLESDMFEKIEGKFDMIVSNPPYIETETIQTLSPEVKNEPMLALDGGEDGLMFYRMLADKSSQYLNPNGVLAVEIGYQQREMVKNIFEEAGFCEVYSKKDFGGKDRIVVGKRR